MMVKKYTTADIVEIKDAAHLTGVDQVWCRIKFKGCTNFHEFHAHPLAQNDFAKEMYVKFRAGEFGTLRHGLGDYRTQPADQEQVEENVKSKRNQLLLETDWTDTPAAQSRLSSAQQTAFAAYRQALRDLPSQEGFPWDPIWPSKPN